MHRKIFLGAFLFLSSFWTHAQLLDSLSSVLSSKPSFYGTWGSTYAFISNRFASIQHVRLGLSFSDRLNTGLRFNWLSAKYPERNIDYAEGAFQTRLNYYSFSAFLEYVYFRNARWESSIPVQLSGGWAFRTRNEFGEWKRMSETVLFSYEPMMTIQYRLIRYLGIGAGLGFRLSVYNRSKLNEQFNSPVVMIKSKIYFSEIWKDLKRLGK